INTPEDASRLTNRYLAVLRNDVVKPPENSFYIFDLVGSEVFDEKTGQKVGTISDVEEYPANDVYVITTEEGKKLNLAAVKQFVKSVDIENKKVVIDSSGLIE
ncbi:MAG TPA: ribosome maturation factor RimM, partial [candidate division Zixibacteria bacterium]|nr:ribosome maturation factor RimM [candidate division Zixibacteria bacterium]